MIKRFKNEVARFVRTNAGTYKFISGNTIILQWNEQKGYKEYYTKETTKSK